MSVERGREGEREKLTRINGREEERGIQRGQGGRYFFLLLDLLAQMGNYPKEVTEICCSN